MLARFDEVTGVMEIYQGPVYEAKSGRGVVVLASPR